MKKHKTKPNIHNLISQVADREKADKGELLKFLYQELLETLMEGERTALLGYDKQEKRSN